MNSRAVPEVAPVAGQHRADPRLIEDAGRPVEPVQPLDQGEIERHKTKVRIERAAAFISPCAGHRRQAGDGEQLCGAVA